MLSASNHTNWATVQTTGLVMQTSCHTSAVQPCLRNSPCSSDCCTNTVRRLHLANDDTPLLSHFWSSDFKSDTCPGPLVPPYLLLTVFRTSLNRSDSNTWLTLSIWHRDESQDTSMKVGRLSGNNFMKLYPLIIWGSLLERETKIPYSGRIDQPTATTYLMNASSEALWALRIWCKLPWTKFSLTRPWNGSYQRFPLCNNYLL